MKLIECRKTFLVNRNAIDNDILATIADLHGKPAGRKMVSIPKNQMSTFEKGGKGTSVYMELKRSISNADRLSEVDSVMYCATREVSAGTLTKQNLGKLTKQAKAKMERIRN